MLRKNSDRTDFGLIPFVAPALTVVGLVTMSLPSTAITIPTSYSIPTSTYRNEYRLCAGRLLRVNIAPEVAASACAQALRPKYLASCVVNIEQRTSIAALDALSACRRSRRPEEVSSCVVGINLTITGSAEPASLVYCRRSLLPLRFAECVVGLRRELDAAPVPAMDTCINAADRLPRDLYPNFVPQEGTPPIQIAPPPTTPNTPINTPITPLPGTPGRE